MLKLYRLRRRYVTRKEGPSLSESNDEKALSFVEVMNDTNLEDAETVSSSRLGYKQRMVFERSRKEMP